MNELVIQGQLGQDVTTSLIVAQVFEKEHKNVLRDIETLSCSKDFNRLNFERITYKDARNREQTAYEMTKDGFSFLVMGYTGVKAGQFKEMFIAEFNKREAMLKSDDYILARSQEILHNRLQLAEQRVQMLEGENTHLQEQNKMLAPKAQYTDEVLQSTSTYTFTQCAKELDFRSATAFLSELRRRGIIFKQSGQYQLTSKFAGNGYTATRTTRFYHADGRPDTSTSTVVTEKGRMWLHKLFHQPTA